MPPRTHRDAGPTSDAREPAAAPAAAAPRTPAALMTQLQQGVGNAAVAAYLARQEVSAPATPIDALRELLDDGDEEGALAKMALLNKDDAGTALGMAPVRTAAVDTFDDEEMAQGIKSLKGGSLVQKLNWLSEEGSTYELVKPLIARTDIPAEEKTAVYSREYLRDFFVGLCDNDEMAEVVKLLGGTVTQKLEWMIAEGTSGELVFGVIGLAPVSELYTDSPLPKGLDEGLESELSSGDYKRAKSMLTTGLLNSETEVDASFTETHYELVDPDDTSKGYSLQDFGTDAEYDIAYTRTELRISVKIAFTGEVPTPAHIAIWEAGITGKWNGHYHVENGTRSLPIIFEPVWNSPDEHHEIELHLPPVDREDSSNWYAGPNADPSAATQDTTDGDTAAHEFGHLCGLADEYNLTAQMYEDVTGSAPTGPMPADGYDAPGVMGDHHQAAQGRHFAPFVAWLNANRIPGERPYTAVAGG